MKMIFITAFLNKIMLVMLISCHIDNVGNLLKNVNQTFSRTEHFTFANVTITCLY
jgi:hypothetical protein